MEDKEMIEGQDINGDPIRIGSVVRYIGRNTVGVAVDIKKDEEGVWVLMDTTGLYYKADVLELTSEKVSKKKKEKIVTVDEVKEYLEGGEEASAAELSNVTGGG